MNPPTMQPYQQKLLDIIGTCPKGTVPSLRIGGGPVAVDKAGIVTHAWLGGRWIKLGKSKRHA